MPTAFEVGRTWDLEYRVAKVEFSSLDDPNDDGRILSEPETCKSVLVTRAGRSSQHTLQTT